MISKCKLNYFGGGCWSSAIVLKNIVAAPKYFLSENDLEVVLVTAYTGF